MHKDHSGLVSSVAAWFLLLWSKLHFSRREYIGFSWLRPQCSLTAVDRRRPNLLSLGVLARDSFCIQVRITASDKPHKAPCAANAQNLKL